jgi:hypothetical protein
MSACIDRVEEVGSWLKVMALLDRHERIDVRHAGAVWPSASRPCKSPAADTELKCQRRIDASGDQVAYEHLGSGTVRTPTRSPLGEGLTANVLDLAGWVAGVAVRRSEPGGGNRT